MVDLEDPKLTPLDPDTLKAQFKKLCVDTNNVYQNWQIRVHRSLSWSKRAMQIGADQPETQFLLLWIAVNSLYARWDNERNTPAQDAASRDALIRRACEMDYPFIGQALRAHKPLVKKVLGDPFLSSVFWGNPSNPRAKSLATEDLYHLDRNLKKADYRRVLMQVMGRLAVLRGQIVHGASTGGSKLNCGAVKECLDMLQTIVPILQHIVIEHGCNDDWPELCYPPLS